MDTIQYTIEELCLSALVTAANPRYTGMSGKSTNGWSGRTTIGE